MCGFMSSKRRVLTAACMISASKRRIDREHLHERRELRRVTWSVKAAVRRRGNPIVGADPDPVNAVGRTDR
jgi:hypothetical protein